MERRIVREVDGDTVVLQDEQGEIHKIRLEGIDAPESR
jgi:endonuclease YncB( thermonuclease family)